MSNGNNHQRDKLELQIDQPVKLKLLRDQPHVGSSQHGEYYLYSVSDESGKEYAWFADPPVHEVLKSQGLKAGSLIIAKRVTNGKKGHTQVEVSILGKSGEPSRSADYKQLMKESLEAAVEVTQSIPNVPWRSEDIQKIGVAMYLSGARNP